MKVVKKDFSPIFVEILIESEKELEYLRSAATDIYPDHLNHMPEKAVDFLIELLENIYEEAK